MIKVKPEDYATTDNKQVIRKIAEKMVKELNDRKVSKNSSDFVTDDLPSMSKVMEGSTMSLTSLKLFESVYGVRASRQSKIYQKEQRELYNFWTRVLKLVKD